MEGQKKSPVRLSQCMIVKNEEKNIERALGWAKDVAFEQIVVDTGSTDRTVEIAESLGARVWHFEWIDDFAAAKNYAIKQAFGNWIAFLDADEYFTGADTNRLMAILERAMNNAATRRTCMAIHCPWIQVGDDGKPFAVFNQTRVFRNLPNIRYKGRIHEALTLSGGVFDAQDISIIHTGYAKSAHEDTGKASRNITLLEEELAKKPDDANLKCYLADSLCVDGPAKDLERAEALYAEALESGKPMRSTRRYRAYNYLTNIYISRGETEKAEALCRRAATDLPAIPDFHYLSGSLLYNKQSYGDAWDALIKCEETLKNPSTSATSVIATKPVPLFFLMVKTAQALGDNADIIRCATLLLKEDKYQKGVLTPYLQVLKADENSSDEEIFELLGKLYDFNNTKDKVTILRAAKDAGNAFIFAKVFNTITKDEFEWLTAASD